MKLTLQDVLSWFNSGPTIAANNRAIEAAIENTLSRDGTSPNDMGTDLDLGGHRLINLAAPVDPTDAVRLQDLTDVAEVVTLTWDNVTDKPDIITEIETVGSLTAIRKVPIVTTADADLAAVPSNAGNYTRFSNDAATYTFSGTAGLVEGDEYHGRYIGSGTLTVTASNGMTVNAPAEGTLVVPPQGSFTVKIISATEADLIGVTELAS